MEPELLKRTRLLGLISLDAIPKKSSPVATAKDLFWGLEDGGGGDESSSLEKEGGEGGVARLRLVVELEEQRIRVWMRGGGMNLWAMLGLGMRG